MAQGRVQPSLGWSSPPTAVAAPVPAGARAPPIQPRSAARDSDNKHDKADDPAGRSAWCSRFHSSADACSCKLCCPLCGCWLSYDCLRFFKDVDSNVSCICEYLRWRKPGLTKYLGIELIDSWFLSPIDCSDFQVFRERYDP